MKWNEAQKSNTAEWARQNAWPFVYPFRVSLVFVAKVDLREKEALKVEWGYQGHKETKDLKDSL